MCDSETPIGEPDSTHEVTYLDPLLKAYATRVLLKYTQIN